MVYEANPLGRVEREFLYLNGQFKQKTDQVKQVMEQVKRLLAYRDYLMSPSLQVNRSDVLLFRQLSIQDEHLKILFVSQIIFALLAKSDQLIQEIGQVATHREYLRIHTKRIIGQAEQLLRENR